MSQKFKSPRECGSPPRIYSPPRKLERHRENLCVTENFHHREKLCSFRVEPRQHQLAGNPTRPHQPDPVPAANLAVCSDGRARSPAILTNRLRHVRGPACTDIVLDDADTALDIAGALHRPFAHPGIHPAPRYLPDRLRQPRIRRRPPHLPIISPLPLHLSGSGFLLWAALVRAKTFRLLVFPASALLCLRRVRHIPLCRLWIAMPQGLIRLISAPLWSHVRLLQLSSQEVSLLRYSDALAAVPTLACQAMPPLLGQFCPPIPPSEVDILLK